MAWNLPEDQRSDKPKLGSDPWTGGQKKPENQQPPHLEDLIRSFWKKLRGQTPRVPHQLSTWVKGLLGATVLLWFILGMHFVPSNQLVYTMRFGIYQGQLAQGWQWRAFGLYQVKHLAQPMRTRVNTDVMTQDLNVATVGVDVVYRVDDAKTYLFTNQTPQATLQAFISSALQQTLGATKLAALLSEPNPPAVLNQVSHLVQTAANQAGLGITVETISIDKIAIPDELQELFNKMDALYLAQGDAKQKSLAFQQQVLPPAEMKAQQLLSEAKVYSQQAQLKASTEVADFLALLPSYEQAPQVTKYRLYTQNMVDLLSQATTVIAAKGTTPLISLAPIAITKTPGPKSAEISAAAADPLTAPPNSDATDTYAAGDESYGTKGGYA